MSTRPRRTTSTAEGRAQCTLMLTPWMAPHRVISWQRAIVLLYLGKVEVLEEYDERITAPSITLRTPAVVRLTKGSVSRKHKVRFSRVNIFTRDGFRCQYCGDRQGMDALNYDHVVPRVRGGKTVWGEHRHLLLRLQRSQREPHARRGRHEASSEALQADLSAARSDHPVRKGRPFLVEELLHLSG